MSPPWAMPWPMVAKSAAWVLRVLLSKKLVPNQRLPVSPWASTETLLAPGWALK